MENGEQISKLCCISSAVLLIVEKVLQQLKEKALIRAEMTEDEISCLIKEREAARKNKDFPSDQIRRELTVKGISLMDQPGG